MNTHEIKMDVLIFNLILKGIRVFSAQEDSAEYSKGDVLSIKEVDEDERLTGRSVTAEIVHVSKREGYSVFHIKYEIQKESL